MEVCRKIGEFGLELVKPGDGILTHCNAGQLATVKYGTATAPIYLGQEKGYNFHVFADETRPLLQGARLTAFELHSAGVDVTLICDNMSASVMSKGWVQAVFVGCDRVAANGDTANKIGTSVVSAVAKQYGVPVYICAPTSTIDMATATGADICIEQRKAEEVTDINLYTIAAMTAGQEGEYLTDFEALKDAGAVAVSDNGGTIMNARTARQAMRQAAEVDIPVFAHCEDTNLAARGVMNAGERAKELGLFGIMDAVEDVIVARDILLAKNTGAKLHISHVSNKESAFIIKIAKEQGIPVTAEVAPHHFTLTEDAVNGDDANFKINPPLRKADDVKALKEALASGVIDVIATDHAPHHPTEKERPFDEAPFGVVGLETAVPVTITELVRTGVLTPLQMVEKMSYNPAKILGIDRGVLAPGKVADITVVNPTEEYDIDSNRFASKGKNTPFEGKHVYGKVLYTLVNGRVVYSDHNGTEILIEREVPKL